MDEAQFLDFALYGGGMSNSSTRTVANNLAPDGLESATASYGGWFVSPELIYGLRIPMMDFVMTPRASVRYVGGVLDGYTEAGSAQDLTVSSRSIDDVEERLEIELSRVAPVTFGGTLKTTVNFGMIGPRAARRRDRQHGAARTEPRLCDAGTKRCGRRGCWGGVALPAHF